MKRMKYWILMIATGMILGATPTFAQKAPDNLTTVDRETVNNIIEAWPSTSKEATEAMIKKYGQPHEATQSMLVWHNNGPWKRTIIYNEEVTHNFPLPHNDVLEQYISYDVPVDKFDELAQYDGSVIVERTKGEISARCDKEAANFLALNLSYDIIKGNKTVEEARKFYAETIAGFMMGEEHEYTQGLIFKPMEDSGDPDEIMMTDAIKGILGGG